MIHSRNNKRLYEKLKEASYALKNAKNRDERIALSNYIFNIYNAIELISSEKKEFNSKNIFGKDKDFIIFNKKLDYYCDKVEKKFATDIIGHREFLVPLMIKTEKEIVKYQGDDYSGITILNEDDFYGIFYDFMKSLGLNRCFDKFVKEGRIYTTSGRDDELTLGYTITNPITKECNIFVNDMQYDINSMFTLAHEFGHVYDMRHFDDDINTFNRYFYQSFYGEVISKTFERLFLNHMIDNNVLADEAKDSLFDMEVSNHEFVIGSVLLSLIPSGLINDGSYLELDKNDLKVIAGVHFQNRKGINNYINDLDYKELEISNVLPYTYGDIISMFMVNSIEKYGFSEEAFKMVFENRGEIFSNETLDRYGISTDKYIELYKKELQKMKK